MRDTFPTATFVFDLSATLLEKPGARRRKPANLTLQATWSDLGLRELSLLTEDMPPLCLGLEDCKKPRWIAEQFEELKLKLLSRLNGGSDDMQWSEFDLRGQTEFNVRVWQALHAIPFGQTKTYGEIARAIGAPQASRAVGRACGANPILLFIPCHRVVGASSLTGFACGLEWKERFLTMEGVDLGRFSPQRHKGTKGNMS